ncbi:MAG TPA: tetratricopeptide repeat-containing protein kinase family protein, partial [Enhygromyxa sp.]|nr:tetratricopeptide repeat-containing protein kinase family protein [Enhygromyxa sp.]
QFAFCVALWEALLGERPFTASTWTQLRAAIRSGPSRELDRPRRMPPRLLAILRRGLAEDPTQRYPDLDALLEDLRELATRRRRVAIGLAALALALIGGAGVSYALLATPPEPEPPGCPVRPTADVLRWHPNERQAVVERLRSGELGEREATQVIAELDQFAARWEYARAQTCAYMVVEDDDDHSSFHDRAFCMYAGAAAFEASIEVLTAPEAELRLIAQPLAAELPDPSRCVAADPEHRRYDDKPPSLDVRRKLARASALQRGQRQDEALALVEELRAAAESEGHGKVLALVELQRGMILHSMGRSHEALRTLERAQALAEVTSALQTELSAAHYCASAAMSIDEDPAQIDAWAERTVLLAEDLNDPAVAVDGRLIRGYAALRAGDGYRALALQLEALADAEAIFGPDAPQLAYAHDYLGATYGELGEVAQAREHKRRAVELLEAKFGPSHLDLATLLRTSGKIMAMVGERDEARELLERAHVLLLELLGPEHRRTRIAARTLAGYWFDEGQVERAEALIGDTDDPIVELMRAELACDAGDLDAARAGLERLRLALAQAEDLPLRVATLDLEGRIALADPSIHDGAARARIVAEAIDVLAGALTQPRHRIRAATLRVAADLREGIDDPRHREQLELLLHELPGVAADLRARARLALSRTSTGDQALAAAARTALAQAFGPAHPLRASALEPER